MYKIEINSLDKLKALGEYIGKNAKAGQIICLNGNLGAGKTTMTQSIAIGMGIDAYVTSPTFTLVNEYYGERNLFHFDTYRLERVDEFDLLGFDEYLYSDGVCVIEWADRIVDFLPEDYLVIDISVAEDNNSRIL
ncbi:MAG: tRNA (adenosine(37)-N6)-threonylcarbamoyltransferase complex ATPase subunit type 1 TsaE [Tissierellia bacterium]|nr:tRNA (adenosine(37)-N6)-threonylcarbamoyltransferase complex ATPase subunit type 1 TsaE [Tissierellia bacterium]